VNPTSHKKALVTECQSVGSTFLRMEILYRYSRLFASSSLVSNGPRQVARSSSSLIFSRLIVLVTSRVALPRSYRAALRFSRSLRDLERRARGLFVNAESLGNSSIWKPGSKGERRSFCDFGLLGTLGWGGSITDVRALFLLHAFGGLVSYRYIIIPERWKWLRGCDAPVTDAENLSAMHPHGDSSTAPGVGLHSYDTNYRQTLRWSEKIRMSIVDTV
jgi:hypothetical protein